MSKPEIQLNVELDRGTLPDGRPVIFATVRNDGPVAVGPLEVNLVFDRRDRDMLSKNNVPTHWFHPVEPLVAGTEWRLLPGASRRYQLSRTTEQWNDIVNQAKMFSVDLCWVWVESSNEVLVRLPADEFVY
jgi:hypothetical protein